MRPAWAFAPAGDPGGALPGLCRALELAGDAVLAGHDPHGRPRALLDGRALPVSVSRCRGRTAVALGRAGRVGVDLVDPAVPHDLLALATPSERVWLADLPGPERRRRLFQLWAGREALLKALGLGLALDPAAVELGPHGDGLRVLRAPGGGDGWQLEVAEAQGLILALAWAG